MKRELAISLTHDEVKEAIKRFIESETGDEVKEVKIEVDGFKMITHVVICNSIPPNEIKG